MKAQLKKYWPEVTLVVGYISTNFGTQIMTAVQNFVATHGHIATTVAAVAIYAARISKSPVAKA